MTTYSAADTMMRGGEEVQGTPASMQEQARWRALHKMKRVLILGAVFILLGGVFVFFVGRWLVIEDPLEKAQAIAVLSGGMPVRAIEAAKLYREGYAPQVWLTHSLEPGARLKTMGIPFFGEDFYDARILVRNGVPEDAIRILDPPIINTADEVRTISGQLERDKGTAVIIVTGKVHTRRTRILWHRLAGDTGAAVVRGASEDPFDAKRWWGSTRDALDVVREVLGVLNAAAGLPLQPSR